MKRNLGFMISQLELFGTVTAEQGFLRAIIRRANDFLTLAQMAGMTLGPGQQHFYLVADGGAIVEVRYRGLTLVEDGVVR